MAGDWIKMRGNLWDDPRVACLCDATDQSEAAIVGALYWLWATADQHTEDGLMPGLSFRQIDRKTGIQGLAEALADIGWIEQEQGGIRITRFDEHNGSSAKRRAQEAKRKAGVRNVSATDADKAGTDGGSDAELEKELEKEKKKTKQSRAVALPDDMQPTDGHKALADKLGVALMAEFEKFCDHHKAKGSTFKDWNAALNNWLRNAAKFQAERNPTPPSGGAPRLKEFRP